MNITREMLTREKAPILSQFMKSFQNGDLSDCVAIVNAIEAHRNDDAVITTNIDKIYSCLTSASLKSFTKKLEAFDENVFNLLPVYIEHYAIDFLDNDKANSPIYLIIKAINSIQDESSKRSISDEFQRMIVYTVSKKTFIEKISYDYIKLLKSFLSFGVKSECLYDIDIFHTMLVTFNNVSQFFDSKQAIIFDSKIFKTIMLYIKLKIPITLKHLAFESASYFVQLQIHALKSLDDQKFTEVFQKVLLPFSDEWEDLIGYIIDSLERETAGSIVYKELEHCQDNLLAYGLSVRNTFKKYGRNFDVHRIYPTNGKLFTYGKVPVAIKVTETNLRNNYLVGVKLLRILMNCDNLNSYSESESKEIGIFAVSSYMQDIDAIIECLLNQPSFYKGSVTQVTRSMAYSITLNQSNAAFLVYVTGIYNAHFKNFGDSRYSLEALYDCSIAKGAAIISKLVYTYKIVSFVEPQNKIIFSQLYENLKSQLSFFLHEYKIGDKSFDVLEAIRFLHDSIDETKKIDIDFVLPKEKELELSFFDNFDSQDFLMYLHFLLFFGYKTDNIDNIIHKITEIFYPIVKDKLKNNQFDDEPCLKSISVLKAISIIMSTDQPSFDPSGVIYQLTNLDSGNETYYKELALDVFSPSYIRALPKGEVMRNTINFMSILFKICKFDAKFVRPIALEFLNKITTDGSEDNFIIAISCILMGLSNFTSKKALTEEDKSFISDVLGRVEDRDDNFILGFKVPEPDRNCTIYHFKFIDASLDSLSSLSIALAETSKYNKSLKEFMRQKLVILFNQIHSLLKRRYHVLLDCLESGLDATTATTGARTILESKLLPQKIHYAVSVHYNLYDDFLGQQAFKYPAFGDSAFIKAQVCDYFRLAYVEDEVRICVSLDNIVWYSCSFSILTRHRAFHDKVLPFKLLLDIPKAKEKPREPKIVFLNKDENQEFGVLAFRIDNVSDQASASLFLGHDSTNISVKFQELITHDADKENIKTLWDNILNGNEFLQGSDKELFSRVFEKENILSQVINDRVSYLPDLQCEIISLFSTKDLLLEDILKYIRVVNILENDQQERVAIDLMRRADDSGDFWLQLSSKVFIKQSCDEAASLVLNMLQDRKSFPAENKILKEMLLYKSDDSELSKIFKFALREFSGVKIAGGFQGNIRFKKVEDLISWSSKDESRIASVLEAISESNCCYASLEAHCSYINWCDLITGSIKSEDYIALYLYGFRNDDYLASFAEEYFSSYFGAEVGFKVEQKQLEITAINHGNVSVICQIENKKLKTNLGAALQSLQKKITDYNLEYRKAENLIDVFKLKFELQPQDIALIAKMLDGGVDNVLTVIKELDQYASLDNIYHSWIFLKDNAGVLAHSSLFDSALSHINQLKSSCFDNLKSAKEIFNFLDACAFATLNRNLILKIYQEINDDFFDSWSFDLSRVDILAIAIKAFGMNKFATGIDDFIFRSVFKDIYCCDDISLLFDGNEFSVSLQDTEILRASSYGYEDLISLIEKMHLNIIEYHIQKALVPSLIDVRFTTKQIVFTPKEFLSSFGICTQEKFMDISNLANLKDLAAIVRDYNEQLDGHVLTRLREVLPDMHLELISKLGGFSPNITNGLAYLISQVESGQDPQSLEKQFGPLKNISIFLPSPHDQATVVDLLSRYNFSRVPSGQAPCVFLLNRNYNLGFRIKREMGGDYLSQASYAFQLILREGVLRLQKVSDKARGVLNIANFTGMNIRELGLVHTVLRISKWIKRTEPKSYCKVMRDSFTLMGLFEPARASDLAYICNAKLHDVQQQQELENLKKILRP